MRDARRGKFDVLYGNYPEMDTDFNGVDITLNKRLSHRWMMMGSASFGKSMGDIRNTLIGRVLVIFVLLLPKGVAGAWGMLLDRFRPPKPLDAPARLEPARTVIAAAETARARARRRARRESLLCKTCLSLSGGRTISAAPCAPRSPR